MHPSPSTKMGAMTKNSILLADCSNIDRDNNMLKYGTRRVRPSGPRCGTLIREDSQFEKESQAM